MHAVEPSPSAKDPREKLLAVEAAISSRVFEREEEIRGFLCSLIARKHILFLGLKGSAKTSLSRLLCDAVSWRPEPGAPPNDAAYFHTQLGRDSVPDEILGPISNQGFREDTFRRQTAGMLPGARIAHIDEIFDTSPSVLRRMNSILNERTFKNGTDPEVSVPLELLVGSSNFTPEPDANLDAFFDRFLLRYQISYIKDPRNFRAMLQRANEATPPVQIAPMLDEDELLQARKEASRVDAAGIFGALQEIVEKLAAEDIRLSDRRYHGLISIVKAHAYLEGRQTATREDLSILAHALWEDPAQIPSVTRIVLSTAKPRTAKARDIFDDVTDSCRRAITAVSNLDYASASKEEQDRASGMAMDARTKCIHANRQLFELREGAREQGEDTSAMEDFITRVGNAKKEVDDTCFGMT